MVNQHNLAYLAALFPESELVREQLFTRRLRNKQQHMPPTPGITDPSFNDITFQNTMRNSRNFGSLLSTDVISTPKDQVLFLLVLVSLVLHMPVLVLPEARKESWSLLWNCIICGLSRCEYKSA